MLLGYVLKKNTPYSEIQGPRILLQIYPFLSEIVDEGGVISSLTLHPPGGSPPVESAHWRPNPCSEPRAIPSLEEPSH